MKHGYTKMMLWNKKNVFPFKLYLFQSIYIVFSKIQCCIYHALYPWLTLGSKHEKLTVVNFPWVKPSVKPNMKVKGISSLQKTLRLRPMRLQFVPEIVFV